MGLLVITSLNATGEISRGEERMEMMNLIEQTVYSMSLPAESEDLFGYGWIGYVKAEKTHAKENRYLSFDDYARQKIKRSVIDGLRRENPRSAIIKRVKHLVSKEGISFDDALHRVDPFSVVTGERVCVHEAEIPIENRGFDIVDKRLLLAFGFSKLTAREISVVWMSFYRGDTLKKIGESMKISESAASLIRTEALQKMKDAMTFDEV